MTNAKYMKIKNGSMCGEFHTTFSEIFDCLMRQPGAKNMTAKQIISAIDTAFISYQTGYDTGYDSGVSA